MPGISPIGATVVSSAAWLFHLLCGNSLLKGRPYTCSGYFWQAVTDGEYVDAQVVEDGNLISGKGPGRVFAFTVAAHLLGAEAQVRDHADYIYYCW